MPGRFVTGLIAVTGLVLAFSGTALASETTGFIAESYPAAVKAKSGAVYLSTGYGNYSCEWSEISGGLSGPSKTFGTESVGFPEFCSGPLSSLSQWKANGCQFEVTAGAGEEGTYAATAAIGPSGCGPIRVQGQGGGFCSMKIGSQTGLAAKLTRSGSGSSSTVVAEINTSSLHYTKECSSEERSYTNGGFTVSWNLAGTRNGGERDGITIDEAFQVAPGASTSLAAGVTSEAATLKGGVNPHDLATTYQFEYGATTAYGSKTSAESAGSGSTEVAVSQAVNGLSAGTVYHYRISATNEKGTTYGRDETFETVKSGATAANFAWTLGSTVQMLPTEQVFTTEKGKVICQEVSGTSGVLSNTGASNLAVGGLSYHDKEKTTCRGPFGTSLTVNSNGCELQFHAGEHVESHKASGSATIGGCSGENALVMSAPGCTIKWPLPQNLGSVTYISSSGNLIEARLNATGLKHETSGFLCGTGTYTTGAYAGTIVLKGSASLFSVE